MGAAKEVLDFFAWPLKQGIFFLKLGLFITAVICAPFFICFHWIFMGDAEHKESLYQYGVPDTYHMYVLDYRDVGGEYPFQYKGHDGLASPPEFCTPFSNVPIQINDETELSSKHSWVSRKTGKMYRNYALASTTVTTMREYLADLKFGRALYQGITCSAARGDESIRLRDIPAIGLHVTNNMEGDWRDSPYRPILLGMWIDGQKKDEDELPETKSHIADLHDPVLTAGQQKAFDLLDSLRSGDFWVKAAHDNDIFWHDDQIRNHTEWLRKILDQRLPVKNGNELLEVLASPFRR